MYIEQFVNITSRAWALPILAQLDKGVPGRQAPLLSATGAGRTAFAQSMEHLIAIGLIERNPGHGHPLRPEFRLTQSGTSAAKVARKIHEACQEKDHDLMRRSWTLPVLTSLWRPSHFGEIKQSLPTITDRALSQSLKAMEKRDWVLRNVDSASRPPRSLYSAINTGEMISKIAASQIHLV